MAYSLKYFASKGFHTRKWRDDVIQPDDIYVEYHQTPIKEKYEKLCAKYITPEERRVGLSKQAALKRKINKVLMAHLDYIARRQRNLLTYIYGEGGEGKTQFGIALYYLLVTMLLKYHPDWECNWKYTESQDDTQKWIPKIKNGDTVHQDEDPDIFGIGSKNLAKKMNTLLKELRKTQKNIIFCSPTLHVYANVYIAFEIFGIDEDDKYTRALVWYFDRQATEVKACAIGYVEIDAGKVQAEYDDYVIKYKDPHLVDVQERGGAATVSSNVEVWNGLAPAFYECAKKNGWNGNSKKALIETYIGFFTNQCKEEGHAIAPDTADTKQLAELTYKYAQTQSILQKKENQAEIEIAMDELGDKPEVDEIQIANSMRDKAYPDWPTKNKDIDMYVLNKDQNLSMSKIAKQVGYKSTPPVKVGIDRVVHRMSMQIGKYFEVWVTKSIDELDQFDPAFHDGTPGNPDVWAVNNNNMTALVASCKCPSYELDTFSVPVEEMQPEIEKAIQLRDAGYGVKCILKLFNRASKHLWEKEIDIDNPKTITLGY